MRLLLYGCTNAPEHSQRHFPFLALQTFSISCGESVYLSRFTHLVLWLCYLDLGALCSFHFSCLQYLTLGIVLPIKVYASDWFAHLILRLYYLDLGVLCRPHPSCLQYLMRGRVLPIKPCTSDSLVIWALEYAAVSSSFLPSISYAENIFNKQCVLLFYLKQKHLTQRTSLVNSALSPFFLQGFRVFTEAVQGFGRHLIRGTIATANFTTAGFHTFFLSISSKSISGGGHLQQTVLFPHFSYGFRGFTEAGQGSGCHLMQGKH